MKNHKLAVLDKVQLEILFGSRRTEPEPNYVEYTSLRCSSWRREGPQSGMFPEFLLEKCQDATAFLPSNVLAIIFDIANSIQ